MTTSGRYQGHSTAPSAGSLWLDLRVDVDPLSPTSPVTGRVSGDLYEQSELAGRRWVTFVESWVVDTPSVEVGATATVIEGALRSSAPDPRQLRLEFSDVGGVPRVRVLLQDAGVLTTTFECVHSGNACRELRLEIDVCAKVADGRTIPVYEHGGRALDVVACYADAGIAIEIEPSAAAPIDDSHPDFDTWSTAELHDAMSDHFSRAVGSWPSWDLWAVLASRADDPNLAGIMFETTGQRGRDRGPERRAIAVFREHPLFQQLPAAEPNNDAEREALRNFLHTWIHEIGHAFHLPHPWQQGRGVALTWMGYPQTYDLFHGQGEFWQRFDFRFDEAELVHLRHGERSRVIMGGEPWTFGNAGLEAEPVGRDQPPLELLLRSKRYFDFLEPVNVELRLRNRSSESLEVDARLQPEHGLVSIEIRRPNGSIGRHHPLACRVASPVSRSLAAFGNPDGLDRYSESLALSYGLHGFQIDEPGEYQLRAVYRGAGRMCAFSDIQRIRVGWPQSTETEILAQDFFTDDVGLQIYLEDSHADRLAKARDVIREVAERWPHTLRGAKLNTVLAAAAARPFFAVSGGALRPAHLPDPDRALSLTRNALRRYDTSADRSLNLEHARVAALHLDCFETVAWGWRFRRERSRLQSRLRALGVKKPVVERIGQRILPEGADEVERNWT